MFFMTLDIKLIGVPREKIFEALVAEGLRSTKYANLHLLPMYQKKIAYGSKVFHGTLNFVSRNINYKKFALLQKV